MRRLAWDCLGLERDAEGLGRALAVIEGWRAATVAPADRASSTETRNLVDVAWADGPLGALPRGEPRRPLPRDFPAPDERFRGHTVLDASGLRLADLEHCARRPSP